MASLSLYPQLETNLMSNRKVTELILQLKSAKAHGKNYIKVKTHLVRHLLRDRLFSLTKLMASHDLPCSTVTNQIALDQRDSNTIPEFERAMNRRCQALVSKLEHFYLTELKHEYL